MQMEELPTGINIIKGSGRIDGTSKEDYIYSLENTDDTIKAGKGDDKIYGEAGSNAIYFK